MIKSSNKISVFALAGLFLVTSCAKEDGPQPELPPMSTLEMETTDFDESNNPNKTFGTEMDTTWANWGHSATNVVVWNVIITVNMAVPVAAFAEAFNHTPKYKRNKGWVWTYDFRVLGIKHTAELVGKREDSRVNWKMYISKKGHYTDFLWYEGYSNDDNKSGQWTMYNNPNNSTKLLQIDWNRDISTGTADIKYTNVIPGGAENGGYITYGIIDDVTYDAFYDIYNKGKDNLTAIKWNRTNKDGRVQDPNKFGDNDWHCWDTTLHDDECQ